jgi:glycerol-3-phosphate dehydrogenase
LSRLSGIDGISFDALIVGGGMAGAGVARDLALRGLRVALFEKGDFASGTTSKSSKLIHGGLRYLELFDWKLVSESLRERQTLQRLAPHLIRPLPFLIPIYRGSSRGLIKVRIGLSLYNLLTPGKSAEHPRTMRAVEALALESSLRPQDLAGAGYYVDDLLLSPERLCLENVLSAARHGARVFNYAQVEEFIVGPEGVEGVRVSDLLTGEVHEARGRIVVNATGPWVDRLRELAGVRDMGRRVIRATKGSHCLLPRMTDRAVYLSAKDDRMIFVIPWRDFSLVGTTDTDFDGDPDRVRATGDDVDYLLKEAGRAIADPRVSSDNVFYTYAGIRPLTFKEGKSASAVSRQHRAFAEGPGGSFLTITGTKLTCFRSLAQEVGDQVMKRLGRRVKSRTAALTLDGADEEAGRLEARAWMDVSGEMAATGLGRQTVEALVATYGRLYPKVLELARKLPDGAETLCPGNPEIVAQLHYALSEEMTVSLQDFLLRRTGIGESRCQGLDCAEGIGRRMGELLGWTPRRLEAELGAWERHVRQSRRFRDG